MNVPYHLPAPSPLSVALALALLAGGAAADLRLPADACSCKPPPIIYDLADPPHCTMTKVCLRKDGTPKKVKPGVWTPISSKQQQCKNCPEACLEPVGVKPGPVKCELSYSFSWMSSVEWNIQVSGGAKIMGIFSAAIGGGWARTDGEIEEASAVVKQAVAPCKVWRAKGELELLVGEKWEMKHQFLSHWYMHGDRCKTPGLKPGQVCKTTKSDVELSAQGVVSIENLGERKCSAGDVHPH